MLLRIVSTSGKCISIVKVYNAPARPASNSVLDSLYSLSLPFGGNLLISGDFNLYHTRWQPLWPRILTPGAEKFTERADKNILSLLPPADMATHDRGNVLNLILGSSPLVQTTKCTLVLQLDVTSGSESTCWTRNFSSVSYPSILMVLVQLH